MRSLVRYNFPRFLIRFENPDSSPSNLSRGERLPRRSNTTRRLFHEIQSDASEEIYYSSPFQSSKRTRLISSRKNDQEGAREGCMCPLINFHSPKPIPFAGYRYFGRGRGTGFPNTGARSIPFAVGDDIETPTRSKQYCAFGQREWKKFETTDTRLVN